MAAQPGLVVCALLSVLFLAGVICAEVNQTAQVSASLGNPEELTSHKDDHDYKGDGKHELDQGDDHKSDQECKNDHKDGGYHKGEDQPDGKVDHEHKHEGKAKGKADGEYDKDGRKDDAGYQQEEYEDDDDKKFKYYSKFNDGDKDQDLDDLEEDDESERYFKVFDIKEYETKKKLDSKLLQVALNLEFLEAEFFLHATKGHGLDKFAPYLVKGGPKPIGGQKARLSKLTYDITWQFALQEVGHLRAIKKTLGKYYFGRPQLDISKKVFSDLIDKAVGKKLEPPFDVYASPINFFIGVYVIPYVGLTGYVGANPDLLTPRFRRVVAGLLGVEAGQDAVTRQYLYERKHQVVEPYNITVAKLTDKISQLRNKLSRDGILDEGLVVPKFLGAEKRSYGNVLAANKDSLAYARKPWQVFSTVYGTGNASQPGGFFPRGAKGKIATFFLTTKDGYKAAYDGKKDDGQGYDGKKDDGHGIDGKKDDGHGIDGKKDDGHGIAGKKDDGKEDDGHGFDGRKDDGHGFDGKKDDGHGFDGKKDDGHGFDGQDDGHGFDGRDDGHGFDGKDDGHGIDGKKDDGHGIAGEKDDGKEDDGHGFDGQDDGHGIDGQDDGHGIDGKKDDGHGFDGKKDDGHGFDGKKDDGHGFEGKKDDGHGFDGKKDDGHGYDSEEHNQ